MGKRQNYLQTHWFLPPFFPVQGMKVYGSNRSSKHEAERDKLIAKCSPAYHKIIRIIINSASLLPFIVFLKVQNKYPVSVLCPALNSTIKLINSLLFTVYAKEYVPIPQHT